jgi:hypothetical protein
MVMVQASINFDISEGESRKETGIALACMERDDVLEQAREIAVYLAHLHATVTIDCVILEMQARGLHPELLGNAAGSVFRGKQWRFTGRWQKSARVSNHARVNRVWELADD